MAGTSISELIFFIAAIIVSSAVAVALIEVMDSYSDDIEDEASVLRGEMQSRMSFINDPEFVPYVNSTGNLTYYLKNTGTGDLSTDDIVVSANGTALSGNSITVTLMGGASKWTPGEVVKVVFKSTGLREGIDYNGWASTSGLSPSGQVRGSAQDSMIFRIKGV